MGITSSTQMQENVDRRTNTDNGVPAIVPAPVELAPKTELFCRAFAACGSAARAYRESFDAKHMKPSTIRQRAYELVHNPAVAERVRQLLAVAAEGTTVSARSRMVHLQAIVEADPTELVCVAAIPCERCWTDDAFAKALQAYGEGLGTDDPLPPIDTSVPREDCPYGPHERLRITPTDELSPSARKLLKAIRQKSDGAIEVVLHDQLAATDLLNRMQGVYVDRSVNVTLNTNVPALEKLTPEQQLAFLDSLKPAK